MFTTGLEIRILAQVCVDLELSVNEEFFVYGAMVKILATLKNSCAKICYLIQKLKPAIERIYWLQCFCSKCFLS